jgi:hypothetical protein
MNIFYIFVTTLFSRSEAWIALAFMTVVAVAIVLMIISGQKYVNEEKRKLDAADKAVTANPEDINCLIERAEICANLGKAMSGLTDLNRAYLLGASPGDLERVFWLCHVNFPRYKSQLITTTELVIKTAPDLAPHLVQRPDGKGLYYSPPKIMMNDQAKKTSKEDISRLE